MIKIFSHIRVHLCWYVLGLLLILSLILWSAVTHENRNGILTVVFLNVGQGNATYIESPTGIQVIVDGGPNNNLTKELPFFVSWYDRHIDMLIVTNPDRDHYEGFFGLLDKYSVDVFMESGLTKTTAEFTSLKQKLSTKKVPGIIALRGQIIDIGGGAYLEVLFPDRDVSGLASNNASVITRLVYGDTSLLLQGDAPQAMEDFLVSLDSAGLDSDVIEVGHHGSRTSTSEKYIKAVTPEYAVISAGKNNSYSHPHQETLDTLNKLKVMILGTYELGRIVFQSDGTKFVLKK